MKSITLIEKQLVKKTNPELVETIILAKKNSEWKRIAELLTGSSRKRITKNLDEIDKVKEDAKIVVVPGKVLSLGNVSGKIKIIALGFSEGAKDKLLKAGCNGMGKG